MPSSGANASRQCRRPRWFECLPIRFSCLCPADTCSLADDARTLVKDVHSNNHATEITGPTTQVTSGVVSLEETRTSSWLLANLRLLTKRRAGSAYVADATANAGVPSIIHQTSSKPVSMATPLRGFLCLPAGCTPGAASAPASTHGPRSNLGSGTASLSAQKVAISYDQQRGSFDFDSASHNQGDKGHMAGTELTPESLYYKPSIAMATWHQQEAAACAADAAGASSGARLSFGRLGSHSRGRPSDDNCRQSGLFGGLVVGFSGGLLRKKQHADCYRETRSYNGGLRLSNAGSAGCVDESRSCHGGTRMNLSGCGSRHGGPKHGLDGSAHSARGEGSCRGPRSDSLRGCSSNAWVAAAVLERGG